MVVQLSTGNRLWLAVELVGLFAALPGLCVLGYLQVWHLLLVIALIVVISYLRFDHPDVSLEMAWSMYGRRMLKRFLCLAPLLLALVWGLCRADVRGYVAVPADIKPFGLLIEKPMFWALLMVIYPVLSVWPQEVVYRRFFFARYRPLLGEGVWLILVNALVFGWAHVLFENSWAIFLTLLGGWIFAETYRRTNSLLFVCVEHALYGWWIFTVGLGPFFLG